MKSVTDSMNLMDKGVRASLDYYRSRIESSAAFPREVLDAAFEEIKNEQRLNDDFARALLNRVELYKKHVDTLRRGDRASLSGDRLARDVIPAQFR